MTAIEDILNVERGEIQISQYNNASINRSKNMKLRVAICVWLIKIKLSKDFILSYF